VVLIAFGLTVPGWGNQVLPLEDVVPLEQLEIQTNDLIELTTALADGVRELKTAELSMQTLQALQPSAAITGLEMQIAQINVQTAQHKVNILRAIAQSQLAIAQARLDFLRRLGAGPNGAAQATDSATNTRVSQAEATVRILQMILNIK
jgi:hypothetical protein